MDGIGPVEVDGIGPVEVDGEGTVDVDRVVVGSLEVHQFVIPGETFSNE